MSAALEKLLEKERLDAEKEGYKIGTAMIVKRFIKDGTFSNEKIAQIVGLSLEEVNKLAEEL